MKKSKSVRLLCDVYCDWSGNPPIYRLYVDNELFTERTWIWTDFYLEEAIHIDTTPGIYQIRYELVNSESAFIKVKNARVDYGNAVIHKKLILEILP